MTILDRLWHWWLRRLLVKRIGDAALDEFLELLLKVMRLRLRIDPDYRRNIEGFTGRYVFRTRNDVAVSAVFENGTMRVLDEALSDGDVIVTFKDNAALCEFLLSRNPDVFAFVIDNKVEYEGNLNYVLKFGYMARRLQLELQP